ncbi:MAG: PAS domain-containing protein [Lachnospiraceae bacterium]|nr:PAS domain-containing protein [Lachnospiraceae bacterium]
MGLFGLIVSSFLFAQFWFPYLPLYGIAYMLGTCLLRSFVVVEEKEEYRGALIEAEKTRMLKQSISALLDNMPALTFSKDAKTGVYLACNQAFAEYAHKEKPEGVVGLTDAEIFDPVTAEHFVEDDRMALSMEEPYIFFEDVPDAAGNQRQFQTTKLKYIDTEGRLCTLGMCQDVTDMIRIQREHAMTKEAFEKAKSNGIIYTHIAQTLARGYEDLYYVNLETEEYIEYHTDDVTGMFNEVRRGQDFFAGCKKEAEIYVYQEDRADVQHALNKETLIDALSRNGTFFMTYRLLSDHGMDGVLAGSADHTPHRLLYPPAGRHPVLRQNEGVPHGG